MTRIAYTLGLAVLIGLVATPEPGVAQSQAEREALRKRMEQYYRSLSPAQKRALLQKIRARKRQRKAAAGTRNPASYSAIRVQNREKPAQSSVELFASALLGMAFVSGSETENNQELSAQSDSALNFGVSADARFFKYLGAELDAQYSLSSTQEVEAETNQLFRTTRGRRTSAGFLNLKGQLPFRTGSIEWAPKAGVGYGALLVTDDETFSVGEDSEGDSITTTASGGYWTAGLDVRPGEKWFISLDYAMGVNPSGKMQLSPNSGATGSEVRLQDTAMSRLRLGVNYRITPNIWVGGQFIQRNASFVLPINGGGTSIDHNIRINQNQVMGTVSFTL